MNLEQMYKMQCELDERIIKDKDLEGVDLMPNTLLALLVELGECANEWRGFKHWSDRQEPKRGYAALVDCRDCQGKGFFFDGERVKCQTCASTGKVTNPLLEEYVDCVHFFLSIARQNDWLDHLYIYEEAIEDVREKGLDGGVCGAFREVFYFLGRLHENDRNEKIERAFGYSKQVFLYRNAWFVFIAIGLIGFGFTLEQIAEAYMDKNKVNHDRQATGY